MGTDAKYQAMPEACALLERAKVDNHWLDQLPFYDLYADGQRLRQLKAQRAKDKLISDSTIAFAEETIRTEQLYPGLKERSLNWGRSWDMVYYLLSAQRRGEEPGERDDLIARAILGGDSIDNAHGEDRLINDVKYLPSLEVEQVVNVLSQVTENQMREYLDYRKMEQDVVYKIWQVRHDEHGFKRIYEAFEKFRDFYRLVSLHHEGVITYLF